MSNILKFSTAVRVGVLAADPSGVENGTIYYNSADGKFRKYEAGAWSDIANSDVSDALFRISDNSDATKKMAFEVSGVATGTTRTVTMPDANVNLGLIASAIQSTEKGAANGVATLDAGGLIPTAQLPPLAITSVSVVANTAARLALTAQMGDVAIQTDNSLTYILSTNSPATDADWKVITAAGAVTSVNGQTGTVSLTTTNIAEGTNLYHTTARAKAAAVADAIVDGVTDVAPSQNAVFDALALKQDASGTAAAARAAAVADSITNGVVDVAPSQNAVFDALALKLANVVEDTSPSLGGALDLNGQNVEGLMHRAAVGGTTSFVEEEYIHGVSLTASQTNTVLASLSLAHASFEGEEITYKIKEATTNRVRIGTLRIVTNGTDISVVDSFGEAGGDVGVTWSAVINGASLDVRYSSTANAKTMRADVKRFKA